MSHSFLIYLASLTIRAWFVAALAGILTWRVRNIAVKHAIWLSALGIMTLMPLADFALPPWLVANSVPEITMQKLPALQILRQPASAAAPASMTVVAATGSP